MKQEETIRDDLFLRGKRRSNYGPALCLRSEAYVFWLNSGFFGCWRLAALRLRSNAYIFLAKDIFFLAIANRV